MLVAHPLFDSISGPTVYAAFEERQSRSCVSERHNGTLVPNALESQTGRSPYLVVIIAQKSDEMWRHQMTRVGRLGDNVRQADDRPLSNIGFRVTFGKSKKTWDSLFRTDLTERRYSGRSDVGILGGQEPQKGLRRRAVSESCECLGRQGAVVGVSQAPQEDVRVAVGSRSEENAPPLEEVLVVRIHLGSTLIAEQPFPRLQETRRWSLARRSPSKE